MNFSCRSVKVILNLVFFTNHRLAVCDYSKSEMSDNPFETFTSPVEINTIVENVLLMTLNRENTNGKLYLVNDDTNNIWTMELIEMNFFERIMTMAFEGGDDSKVIHYLYNSYVRLQEEITKSKSDVFAVIDSLIFRNIATALKEPDLFLEQNISSQILDIFKDNEVENSSTRETFLSNAIAKALEEADESMKKNVSEIFFKCFDECLKAVRQMSMITLDKWILNFLMAFVRNAAAANLFLDYIKLPNGCEGIKYADSLLGE